MLPFTHADPIIDHHTLNLVEFAILLINTFWSQDLTKTQYILQNINVDEIIKLLQRRWKFQQNRKQELRKNGQKDIRGFK